jgi:Bacterial nucleoid DNA-binding protein
MPSFFKKTERANPLDRTAPKKWYCVLRRIKKAKTSDVAKAASITTTADPKLVELSILRYFETIVNLLQDGRSVEIEGFGTFRLTVSSEGANTKEELNSGYIKRGNVRFIPSLELKERINRTQYIDIDEFSKDANSNDVKDKKKKK